MVGFGGSTFNIGKIMTDYEKALKADKKVAFNRLGKHNAPEADSGESDVIRMIYCDKKKGNLFGKQALGNIMVRILENGTVIRVDSTTRNAVKTTLGGKVLKIVQGTPIPQESRIWVDAISKDISCNFTDESNKILWLNRIDKLSVLDCETMEHFEVEDFWQLKDRRYFGKLVIADKTYSKFAGIAEGEDGSKFLVCKELAKNKPSKFLDLTKMLAKSIKSCILTPIVKDICCLEATCDGSMILIGGGSKKDKNSFA